MAETHDKAGRRGYNIVMPIFQWEHKTAELKRRLYGIGLDEACEVFDDPYAFEEYDPDPRDGEARNYLIGISRRRVLLVVYVERTDNVIFLLSARRATEKERHLYAAGDNAVQVEVSREDYANALVAGAEHDAELVPGLHNFKRGGFRSRYPDLDAAATPKKVKTTVLLDANVVRAFDDSAASLDGSDADSFDAWINRTLRESLG